MIETLLKPMKAGLIGSGIQGSLTPAMHMREGQAQGFSYEYELIDLSQIGATADDLPRLLDAAEARGLSGLNITHPSKQSVIPYLDELSPQARDLGAVNTIVLRDGKRSGHNTDWWGFAENFHKGLPEVDLSSALQLGVGGAGAATAYALLSLGLQELLIFDREAERAEALARTLAALFPEGELPVQDFMAAVAETGYDGYLSPEIFNDQFRGGSSSAIAADGYRSLLYLGDQIRRATPAISLAVPDMPARSRVEGVAFVEFAVDEAEAPDLKVALSMLGFREDARHKSKNVTVFRQGDIRLVVNAESRGFASSAYLVHGTSAYAIGLLVEDAWAAHARAIALGAEAFEQPLDPGEIEMPAVRGVGGGIVYFLDRTTNLARIWDIEFDALEATQKARDVASRPSTMSRRPCPMMSC